MTRVFYVTVGGSPGPVVRAVERAAAQHVVFICSQDDATTGGRGSWTQVRGEGLVCRSAPGRPPDLPAIPVQLGLDTERWDVILVPADEPLETVRLVQHHIRGDLGRGLGVVVGYAGGTKSMAAGAFLAAALENVDLQLVTGFRVDHMRVLDKMEQAVRLDSTGLAEVLALRTATAAWARHDYRGAAHLLATLHRTTPEARRARALSLGFADWDDFRYAAAHEQLQPFESVLPTLTHALARLERNGGDGDPPDPIHGYDLWLVAERRAVAGRYDIAVLLLYRCFEWIGRWSLRVHHRLDASDVVTDRAELRDVGQMDHRGQRVFSLHATWTALERLEGPMRQAAIRTASARRTYAQLRNDSMLTHGMKALNGEHFGEFRAWLRRTVLDDFVTHAFAGTPPMAQLPTGWRQLVDADQDGVR